MRIVINCTHGGTHSMMLLDHTTVLDVKQYVAQQEGVPVAQQKLLFAGRELAPDTALLLQELQVDSYSLAHEVVVYMQQQLAEAVRVFLCQPGPGPCKLHPELVEAGSSLTNIMAQLTQRGLARQPFPTAAAPAPAPAAAGHQAAAEQEPHGVVSQPGSSSSSSTAGGCGILPGCVVVKREDGSCCSRVRVTEDCSIARLQAAIQQAEGAREPVLTFYQGPDGCLHAAYGPGSADTSTHTCYSRSSMPQPTMLVKEAGCSTCVPYSSLVADLAVVP